MSAIHLECRGPGGDDFAVVAVRGFVVVPESMRRQPGLWWLESENHPHLVIEDSNVLEDVIGPGRLGCWPYCVAAERWNEAAAQHRWLPRSPGPGREPEDQQWRLIENARIEGVRLPSRRTDPTAFASERAPARSLVLRLERGSMAVSYLFAQTALVGAVLMTTLSLAVCAYYLAAVASWLWNLRNGISGREIQDGLVLLLGAFVATWITRRLASKRGVNDATRFRLPDAAWGVRRPLVRLALDAYRIGVALQLLAFAGFAVT